MGSLGRNWGHPSIHRAGIWAQGSAQDGAPFNAIIPKSENVGLKALQEGLGQQLAPDDEVQAQS